MATVTYSMRSSNNDKLSSVYLRFKDSDRVDVKLAVDYLFCLPSNFRNGKCKIPSYKAKASDVHTLNVTLEKLREYIIESFIENAGSIKNEKLWLKQAIKNFNDNAEEKDLDDFIVFLDYYLDSKTQTIQQSTYKKIKTEVTKFKLFVSDNVEFFGAGKKLRFRDIDENFLRKYESYLLSLDYQPDTYKKKVTILKQICVFAKQNGIKVNNVYIMNCKIYRYTRSN